MRSAVEQAIQTHDSGELRKLAEAAKQQQKFMLQLLADLLEAQRVGERRSA
jgi:hypothetical protein